MEVIAKSKFVRTTPRKLRLIADMVRGLKVATAQDILTNLAKKGATPLLAVLKQGIGNAVNNYKLAKDTIFIKRLEINEAARLKRFRFVSRGRIHPVLKRTSHITLVIEGDLTKNGPKS